MSYPAMTAVPLLMVMSPVRMLKVVVFPAPKVKGYRYICSAQFRNLRNLKIAQRILGIAKLRANLEIVQTILRLRNTFAQSVDCENVLRNLQTCYLACG